MAKTKDAVLTPGQKELMEKEYLDFVKPSTYGNKANPSSCDSLYDDVENPEWKDVYSMSNNYNMETVLGINNDARGWWDHDSQLSSCWFRVQPLVVPW